MRRVNGFIISVAALAAVPFFANCYNEASQADGDPSGVGGSSGVTNPSTTTGSSSGGDGGGTSSAQGGGSAPTSTSSAQGGGGSSANGSGGSSGSGGSTGSGSSSTGSGGAPPAGQHCLTYEYAVPANAVVPNGLAIYDQATDAFDTPYLRPNPWDATAYGSAYVWGVAVDSQYDADCSSSNSATVSCTVCRPDYAYVHVNVHVQYNTQNPATRWSCQQGDYFGAFKLWIDGVPQGFAYEPWSDAPDGGSGCRYYFILPG